LERVKRLKKILNEIYRKKENDKSKVHRFWFIEEIWENFVKIREEIKAPEIDELDKISFENVLEWDIKIWKKVKYFQY
jgi:hypothetical protein